MQTFLFIGAGVLFLILIFLILLNISNRTLVKKNWPEGLSFETKIETWYLYSIAGIEFYRVKKSSVLLCDYLHFFLSGYKVPTDCGENNPVVLVVDLTTGTDSEIIMSKRFFMNNYCKYLTFESFGEYKNYMSTSS